MTRDGKVYKTRIKKINELKPAVLCYANGKYMLTKQLKTWSCRLTAL